MKVTALKAFLSTSDTRRPVTVTLVGGREKDGFVEARDGGVYAVKSGGAGRPLLITADQIDSVVERTASAAPAKKAAPAKVLAPVQAKRGRKLAPAPEPEPTPEPVAEKPARRTRKAAAPAVEPEPTPAPATKRARASRATKNGSVLTVVPE